ncbi:hypothetical protein TYRP_002069 [Tyrophagus putrescentiae]|nr:hypothetical protein TYRP_002069 [Tyrophagus putrescentiae]
MNEIKVAEAPTQGGSVANAVSDCQDDQGSMISRDTQVVKSKKSSARSKSKRSQKPGSKKSKVSSGRRSKSKSAKSKNKSKKTDFLVQQFPKLSDYVVESINARIDTFPKQFDHNCSKKCSCSKGKKERKSKKKKKKKSRDPNS